jgi:hypothetical protein
VGHNKSWRYVTDAENTRERQCETEQTCNAGGGGNGVEWSGVECGGAAGVQRASAIVRREVSGSSEAARVAGEEV